MGCRNAKDPLVAGLLIWLRGQDLAFLTRGGYASLQALMRVKIAGRGVPQTKRPARGGLFDLVAGTGFEPVTFRL